MTEHQDPQETMETTPPLSQPTEIPTEEEAIPLLEVLATLSYSTFEEAGLEPEVLAELQRIQWTQPTPIQSQTLPYSLRGQDIAGFAQTGSGKTGVFAITLANFLQKAKKADPELAPKTFGVVITPTRELAQQIGEELTHLFAPMGLTTVVTVGGMDWDQQFQEIQKKPSVIVATPGRLRDFLTKEALSFQDISLFVCDEVDRMCDMGFIQELEFFLEKLPANAQKLLFSATTSDRVDEVIFEYLNDPHYVSLNSDEIAPERIEQHAIICEAPQKIRILLHLLQLVQNQRSVVFANTRLTAAWLHYKLRANGIQADLITGGMQQNKRTRLLKSLKTGNTNILIATDVASRGLHIPGITHVFNFDVPEEPASYIHRIGRTARAGAQGKAYTLVCDCYGENFVGIQDLLGTHCPRPVWVEEAFLQTPDRADNPFATQILRFDYQSKKGFEYDENWEQKKVQQAEERERERRRREQARTEAPRAKLDPVEQSYQQRYQQELARKKAKQSWLVRLIAAILAWFRPKSKTQPRGNTDYRRNDRPPYNRDRNQGPRQNYNRDGQRGGPSSGNRDSRSPRDRDSYNRGPNRDHRPDGNRPRSPGGLGHRAGSESQHHRDHFANKRGKSTSQKRES